MTEVTTTTATQRPAREQLHELAQLLRIGETYRRLDGGGLAFLAGHRGIVRPGPGGELVVVLRKPQPALVEQLVAAGLIAVTDTGNMVLVRMPEPREFGLVRELAGLSQVDNQRRRQSSQNAGFEQVKHGRHND
jgi:hypothetical protein